MICKREPDYGREVLEELRRAERRRLRHQPMLRVLTLRAILPKREGDKLLADIEDLLDKNRSTYDIDLNVASTEDNERWDRVVGVEKLERAARVREVMKQ